MFCPNCGKPVPLESRFCASCGTQLPNNEPENLHKFVTSPANPTETYLPYEPNSMDNKQDKQDKQGLGFGVAGLIVGILALVIGFFDYSLLGNGTYGYILESEIGILTIISIIGIVFGSISTSKKSSIGTWGLVVSILALLFTFFLAQFSG